MGMENLVLTTKSKLVHKEEIMGLGNNQQILKLDDESLMTIPILI